MAPAMTLAQLTAALARREISARQSMQACLDRIQAVDGEIRTFLKIGRAHV